MNADLTGQQGSVHFDCSTQLGRQTGVEYVTPQRSTGLCSTIRRTK